MKRQKPSNKEFVPYGWSVKQARFVRDNVDKYSNEKLAFLIGKGIRAVIAFKHRLGLKQGKRGKEEPEPKPQIKRPPAVYSNKSFWN